MIMQYNSHDPWSSSWAWMKSSFRIRLGVNILSFLTHTSSVSHEHWWLCILCHGIQISMETSLACRPALSTKWLNWVAFGLNNNICTRSSFQETKLSAYIFALSLNTSRRVFFIRTFRTGLPWPFSMYFWVQKFLEKGHSNPVRNVGVKTHSSAGADSDSKN